MSNEELSLSTTQSEFEALTDVTTDELESTNPEITDKSGLGGDSSEPTETQSSAEGITTESTIQHSTTVSSPSKTFEASSPAVTATSVEETTVSEEEVATSEVTAPTTESSPEPSSVVTTQESTVLSTAISVVTTGETTQHTDAVTISSTEGGTTDGFSTDDFKTSPRLETTISVLATDGQLETTSDLGMTNETEKPDDPTFLSTLSTDEVRETSTENIQKALTSEMTVLTTQELQTTTVDDLTSEVDSVTGESEFERTSMGTESGTSTQQLLSTTNFAPASPEHTSTISQSTTPATTSDLMVQTTKHVGFEETLSTTDLHMTTAAKTEGMTTDVERTTTSIIEHTTQDLITTTPGETAATSEEVYITTDDNLSSDTTLGGENLEKNESLTTDSGFTKIETTVTEALQTETVQDTEQFSTTTERREDRTEFSTVFLSEATTFESIKRTTSTSVAMSTTMAPVELTTKLEMTSQRTDAGSSVVTETTTLSDESTTMEKDGSARPHLTTVTEVELDDTNTPTTTSVVFETTHHFTTTHERTSEQQPSNTSGREVSEFTTTAVGFPTVTEVATLPSTSEETTVFMPGTTTAEIWSGCPDEVCQNGGTCTVDETSVDPFHVKITQDIKTYIKHSLKLLFILHLNSKRIGNDAFDQYIDYFGSTVIC